MTVNPNPDTTKKVGHALMSSGSASQGKAQDGAIRAHLKYDLGKNIFVELKEPVESKHMLESLNSDGLKTTCLHCGLAMVVW